MEFTLGGQDIEAGEKIKGIVTELLTYDDKGKRVGSKLVFRPFCEYYVPKWNDEYAETEFTPDKFVEDFGEDIFKKVTAGEIVEAENAIGEYSIKKTCSIEKDFIKVQDKIIFPYEGKTERLVRKSIYLKIHPEMAPFPSDKAMLVDGIQALTSTTGSRWLEENKELMKKSKEELEELYDKLKAKH